MNSFHGLIRTIHGKINTIAMHNNSNTQNEAWIILNVTISHLIMAKYANLNIITTPIVVSLTKGIRKQHFINL